MPIKEETATDVRGLKWSAVPPVPVLAVSRCCCPPNCWIIIAYAAQIESGAPTRTDDANSCESLKRGIKVYGTLSSHVLSLSAQENRAFIFKILEAGLVRSLIFICFTECHTVSDTHLLAPARCSFPNKVAGSEVSLK